MGGDSVALFVDFAPRYFIFSPPSVSSFWTCRVSLKAPQAIRQTGSRAVCVRAVRDDRSTCRSRIKQIKWNTSSHKYKQYRGKISQLSILLPPLISLSPMPQEGGGATRWTGRHCTAGPHRQTPHYEKWIPDWHRKPFQLTR